MDRLATDGRRDNARGRGIGHGRGHERAHGRTGGRTEAGTAGRAVARALAGGRTPEGGPVAVLEAAAAALAGLVPYDLWAGVLLDPVTLLNVGGCYEHGVGAAWMPRLLDIEYREGDALLMPALARQPCPVGTLTTALDGRLERSVRYRDIYRPLGLADEMRVLLRDAGRVWGALVLVRSADRPPFSAAETATAARLSGPLGRALRDSLTERPAGPGLDVRALVVLDARYETVTESTTAAAWYAELAETPARGTGLPAAAYGVAAAALSSPTGGSRVCVPTRSGGWAAIEGWRLETGDGARIALSLGPASPPDRVAALMEAYALSPRECQILAHVVSGAPTNEIASRLALSPFTVQDHLKSVFAKTGVRSRRELVSQVFFSHYLPDLPLTGPGPEAGAGERAGAAAATARASGPARPA
ncbi:helix-turn-helix transcriptional regulator [Streptomyces sp. NPDC006339]|uniref:helix-turn-helix transcriptional regulator n=1 Tax=Streptomyces sp. NPDC006339 TaxID=3156755 RepID=UPI0033A634BC